MGMLTVWIIEDAEEDEVEDEPLDPLVEALFDEVERMRIQVRHILPPSPSFNLHV